MIIDIVKVVMPAALAFFVGIALTPFVTHFLYKHRLWKKRAGKHDLEGNEASVFNSLHKDKEVGTPRMGGIIIWVSSVITIVSIWAIAQLFPTEVTAKLDFLSRSQTWLPLFTLVAGSVVGLIDDFLEVRGTVDRRGGSGLSLRIRLAIVSMIGLFVAWWFFWKLDISAIGLPFVAPLEVGIFFIPFFLLVVLAIYAAGVIDGIDGLSGGVFGIIFIAYAGIAFYQQQIDLAAFSVMIAGAILAFLWFNIPPARFYMSETGTMGLTITLATVAFMTDVLGEGHGVFALPIIAFPLTITVLSNVVQVCSKRLRGKKVFLVAPLHHHFEAKGWPGYKVTMRYWVIGTVFALIGLIVALIG